MVGAKYWRLFAAVWGIAGIILILASPMYRLFQISWPVINSGDLVWYHWVLLLLSIVFMAYAEGYKGFQQNFSPRVAARARYLGNHAGLINGLLAPLFCMGYFGATRRRQIASLILTSMLILLIVAVSFLPQPWRTMIDAGVVIGLFWGIISVLIFALKALLQKDFPHDAELADKLRSKAENNG